MFLAGQLWERAEGAGYMGTAAEQGWENMTRPADPAQPA